MPHINTNQIPSNIHIYNKIFTKDDVINAYVYKIDQNKYELLFYRKNDNVVMNTINNSINWFISYFINNHSDVIVDYQQNIIYMNKLAEEEYKICVINYDWFKNNIITICYNEPYFSFNISAYIEKYHENVYDTIINQCRAISGMICVELNIKEFLIKNHADIYEDITQQLKNYSTKTPLFYSLLYVRANN